jgi:hypothetical protein
MSIVDFTYDSYIRLLNTVVENGYNYANYHNYREILNSCILRHDVDYDLNKALEFAKVESSIYCAGREIQSTYFVLLTSPLYNIFSNTASGILKEIASMGHEIGLHFDETQYMGSSFSPIHIVKCIQKELGILEQIIERPITVVSMHRPSQSIIEADITIPNAVNSYSQTFFKEFKYISDSRHNWRENPETIVSSGQYKRLHILTHPFWYTDKITSCRDKLFSFITAGNISRYYAMNDNFRDLCEFVQRSEIE